MNSTILRIKTCDTYNSVNPSWLTTENGEIKRNANCEIFKYIFREFILEHNTVNKLEIFTKDQYGWLRKSMNICQFKHPSFSSIVDKVGRECELKLTVQLLRIRHI